MFSLIEQVQYWKYILRFTLYFFGGFYVRLKVLTKNNAYNLI